MNILTTENLCKKYKDRLVVNNVNMHINEGDIYGFVGENGAGKTTIIRLITSLAKPTSGSIALCGYDINSKEAKAMRSQMGGIIESVSLNTGMTAIENLKVQCYLSGVKKTDEELIELIERVGLNYDEIAKKKTGNFSLGMRQRLGIAIILVNDPKFILLDEPMNGLDPQGFIDVRETILRLHEQGITFLISSHILSELEKICNRVGFISHGKLIKEVTMDQIHEESGEKVVVQFSTSQEAETFKKAITEELKLEKVVAENVSVSIYDKVTLNDVMQFISKKNFKATSFNSVSETIEDYYINAMKEAK